MLDLCSSLGITGPSLLAFSICATDTGLSKNITPKNGLVLSPKSHYNAAPNVHYFRWLLAAAPPKSRGGGARALQAPGVMWQTEVRATGRRRKRKWVGLSVCSRARGQCLIELANPKCVALMTSPEEKPWRDSLDEQLMVAGMIKKKDGGITSPLRLTAY